MASLIVIAVILHIALAVLTAWAIVAWRTYVKDGREHTEPEQ